MSKLILGLATSAMFLTMVGSASAVTLYDAQGFERPAFVPGALNGQDFWTGGSLGGGTDPVVVTAPDPVLGEQAVRLEAGDSLEDLSLMEQTITLPSLAGQIVTVSFDIYRPTPVAGQAAQDLWWFWVDNGEPAGGLQWDGGATLPFGGSLNTGAAVTIFDQYANVTMQWDFQQMKASSWYNGVLVDDGFPISGITALTAWDILLSNDAGDGTGTSVAYIDNLIITAVPEPATLTALAVGALALLRRRR